MKILFFQIFCLIFIANAARIKKEAQPQNREEWSYNDPRWENDIPDWFAKDFIPAKGPQEEYSKSYWNSKAQKTLKDKISTKINLNTAKNIIIMIGDGMGLPSIVAARSYLKDISTELSFDKLPYAGLSRTYSVNYQVPDSACTATAIMRGVKTNFAIIGLTASVSHANCTASLNKDAEIPSIFKYAQDAGKSTGIVTTTKVTHSTPAAAYAHSASPFWEYDRQGIPAGCDDIGKQLIYGQVGSKLNVILGGGLSNFMPENLGGKRKDGSNLVNEYKNQHKKSTVVLNKAQLKDVNPQTTEKLLGLFANGHMDFKLLADDQQQPTLTEMTAKALELLKKNQDNGYVLMIEGGLIDRGHHLNQVRNALEEVVEFHRAVEYVRENTNEEDTLLIVTADHSHPFSVGAYPPRGRNILGPGHYSFNDNKWVFSTSYTFGPGYYDHVDETTGTRKSPRGMNYMSPTFRPPSIAPLNEGTHSAEDVGVFSSGPYAHLLTGVYEQNFIAHAMMYASCLGPDDVLKNPNCEDASDNEI